ncbi:type II secretion system F family protein [Opitutales bacterium ASA1]|uniref:type II secretion system F family protein n=1 Tax=Congregicoccus parvus TaxID=3081749 RepID=UPI002B300A25|nr:type II secretion system F family protein [Opitutales bacterium ASA1]
MPSFTYTARDAAGAVSNGRLEADSRKGALRQLSSRGLVPVSLKEGAASSSGRAKSRGSATDGEGDTATSGGWRSWLTERSGGALAGVSRKDRLPFLRALSDLLTAGVQTGDAVRMLSRRLSGGAQKKLANALWDGLSQGRSLSQSMREMPAVFDEASISLVEAGEATGNLGEILKRLVTDLEEREELKSKLVGAMAYPIFIVMVAVAVVLVFLYFLLPRIQTLLTGLGGKLPFATRALIGMSEFLVTWGPVLVIGAVLAGVALWAWRKTPNGRTVLDQRVLGFPGLGAFLRDSDLLRMVQTLALLLENGITTLTALTLTERTILNTSIRRSFNEARLKIAEGMPISAALKATGWFPDLVIDILVIGDNTGNLVPGLHEVSRYYRRRQSRQLNFFVGALSIAVLMVAFVFVALIAFGIILAVFQLSSNLRVR